MNLNKLYNGILALTEQDGSPFFFEDTKINDTYSYRVFCYTIPKYGQYQQPFAKETRGSMFVINHQTNEMVDIAALPMPKFFTYGENPCTQNIDFKNVKRFTLKPDGSLLSTYLDFITKELKFKTKRIPNQDSFNKILDEVLYDEFKNELTKLTETHTVDCELTSPQNRVILEYTEPKLTVLKARNKSTGEFLDIFSDEFKTEYPEIAKNVVEELSMDILKDITSKNRNLEVKGIEGGVLEMQDGTLVKIKTMYYLTQNKFANIQDFKKKNQLMVEACLEETFDELRTLFHYRKRSENYNLDAILKDLDSIEEQVNKTYIPFCNSINQFYETHKELDDKDYLNKLKEEGMMKFTNILMPMKKGQKMDLKMAYMKNIGSKIKA